MKKLSKGSIKLICLSIILVSLASGAISNVFDLLNSLINYEWSSFLKTLFLATPIYVFVVIYVIKNINKLYDNKNNKIIVLVLSIVSLYFIAYDYLKILIACMNTISGATITSDYIDTYIITQSIKSILNVTVTYALGVLNAIFAIKTRNAECDHIYKCHKNEEEKECNIDSEVETVKDETLRCPNCNSEIEKDDVFCANCGAKIEK